MTQTLPRPSSASDTGGTAPGSQPEPRRSFWRRHRLGLSLAGGALIVVSAGAGVVGYMWTHNGPSQLSTHTVYERFRSGANDQFVDPGSLRPHEGVYSYIGEAKEHVSLPPKSQTEGPGMPGTVTYERNGCWVWRLDFSDDHWQSSTYCARDGDLVLTGRAGWYKWDFVMLTISDTATFKCSPEITLPKVLRTGERFPLSCKGTNEPLNTGVVRMTGYNEYVGTQTLTVHHKKVPTVHFREVATFSGGQTGTNVANTWFSTVNGLPVRGTWVTSVSSPTFVGTSTLTGNGSYRLTSLTPLY